MKFLVYTGIAFLTLSCGSAGRSDHETGFTPDPLEEVKELFAGRVVASDSVSVQETDSTYTYFVLPRSEAGQTGRELFGAFRIDKKTVKRGDINHDGLEDAVVEYSFTPHLDNNTLIYFKILLQSGGKLEEVGEIYGGGRCEGPILSLKEINKGVIRFSGKEYAEGDPCCCPSVEKEYGFRLEEGKIVKFKI